MGKPALLGGSPVTTPEEWQVWPFSDDGERRALQEVLDSGRWQSGPQVEAFEREFAHYQASTDAVCVTNGTTSLELALRALGVGPGDEVIVPSYTFAATALAVLTVGARPVFVDCESETLNIHPEACTAALSERTRAILPVHVGGHPVDLDSILKLSRKYGLAIVEDAAHAHGAEWRGRRIGSAGDCASFSFQTGKSMTSGDGGCLTTSDPRLAEALRSLRNFGRAADGELERVGGNHRMTEFQAAVLRSQLGRLDEQIALRERNVRRLAWSLEQIPGVRLALSDERVTRHPHYQVVLHLDARGLGIDKPLLLRALAAEGIPFEGGYEPLHRMRLFREACRDERARALPCPVAEKAADEGVVWLSFRMAMADEQQLDKVAEAFAKLHAHATELSASRSLT